MTTYTLISQEAIPYLPIEKVPIHQKKCNFITMTYTRFYNATNYLMYLQYASSRLIILNLFLASKTRQRSNWNGSWDICYQCRKMGRRKRPYPCCSCHTWPDNWFDFWSLMLFLLNKYWFIFATVSSILKYFDTISEGFFKMPHIYSRQPCFCIYNVITIDINIYVNRLCTAYYALSLVLTG